MAVGGFLGFSLLLLQPAGGLGVMRRRRQACLASMKHWQQTDGTKVLQQQKRVFTVLVLNPTRPSQGRGVYNKVGSLLTNTGVDEAQPLKFLTVEDVTTINNDIACHHLLDHIP